MRFIVTNDQKVEQLKKQAKKLRRDGDGKHRDLLDKVARSAGYDHWHHVTLCNLQTRCKTAELSLIGEIAAIVRAAREGTAKCVLTGPEATASQPFVLFSSSDGDAWMLDPEENWVACLRWHGVDQNFQIGHSANDIEVQWDGVFELLGDFFKVETSNPSVGRRAIAGYPVEELREVLQRAQSIGRRFADVFLQDGAVDLTHDIIKQLVRRGWSEKQLRTAAGEGARYSPSRNTLLYPPMDDEDSLRL